MTQAQRKWTWEEWCENEGDAPLQTDERHAFHANDEYITHLEKLAKDRFKEMGRLQDCNLKHGRDKQELEARIAELGAENKKLKAHVDEFTDLFEQIQDLNSWRSSAMSLERQYISAQETITSQAARIEELEDTVFSANRYCDLMLAYTKDLKETITTLREALEFALGSFNDKICQCVEEEGDRIVCKTCIVEDTLKTALAKCFPEDKP